MSELTAARYRTLHKISTAGRHGMRPKGADLTTAFWLRQERLVETFRVPEKMQLQYRISDAGLEAMRLHSIQSAPELSASHNSGERLPSSDAAGSGAGTLVGKSLPSGKSSQPADSAGDRTGGSK